MASKKSQELVIGERNLETGEVSPVRLLVHPPTVDTVMKLSEAADFNPLVLLAGLLERSDKVHNLDWLKQFVEVDDLEQIKAVVFDLMGLERASSPNAPGPQAEKTGG